MGAGKGCSQERGEGRGSHPSGSSTETGTGDDFKQKFGIEIELVLGRGRSTAKRITDEYKAGVRYFDVANLSVSNLTPRLLPMGAIQPLESYWILPEVKDAKQWWGGHIWGDNAKRYSYYAYAYALDNIWYNTDLVKAGEVRTYDDLLDPKWKGKIGLMDPRFGGAGLGLFGFMWKNLGVEYLKKLSQQDLKVIRKRRVLADNLAKGKLSITIGPTFFSFRKFIKAGLPVKPFLPLKEGTYVSVGYGGPVIFKDHPHPNAAKVFVNWLLSKEGQQVWSKTMGHATRRLDVDTKWMPKIGVRAAKDIISVEDFHKRENQTEDAYAAIRAPARKIARELFD